MPRRKFSDAPKAGVIKEVREVRAAQKRREKDPTKHLAADGGEPSKH
jgi:hypothetical protein